jgi:hypothetical protein
VTPSETPAPSGATAGNTATPAETTPAAAAPKQDAPPKPASPTRFEPTEKVRADFDVSFPVDI